MKGIEFNINQNTITLARDVAKLFWNLTHPVAHWSSDNVTKRRWPFIKHPTLNKAAFLYDETVSIPIDSRADVQEIYDTIYYDVTLTDTQKQNIIDFIKDNRSATVEQILRNTWVANAVTYQDLIDDGWFPQMEAGI